VFSDWWFKVQALEAANETLQMQITGLLDRKSPRGVLELDRHLAVVNELHAQVAITQIIYYYIIDYCPN